MSESDLDESGASDAVGGEHDLVGRTLSNLALQRVDEGCFEVPSVGNRHRLFGGLVAAQAAIAGALTVDADRTVHSIHGHFLAAGRGDLPLRFEVEKTLDGGTFSSRYVRVLQDGRQIFTASLSFARAEEGASWQTVDAPEVAGPRELLDRETHRTESYRRLLGVALPPFLTAVEVRLCDPSVVEPGESRDPLQSNWMRVPRAFTVEEVVANPGKVSGAPPGSVPPGSVPLGSGSSGSGSPGSGLASRQPSELQLANLQRALLIYATDRTMLATARLPLKLSRHQIMNVSLDHVVWVHRDVDMSQWHLMRCVSPVMHSGRATVLAHVWNEAGECVATVAQEGLVRERRTKPDKDVDGSSGDQ